MKCIAKTTVRMFDNGSIKVEGMPVNMLMAWDMATSLSATMLQRFAHMAAQDKLEGLNLPQSSIIMPRGSNSDYVGVSDDPLGR